MIKKLALSIPLTLLVFLLSYTQYYGGSYLADLFFDDTLFLDDAGKILPMLIFLSSTIFIAIIFLALLKKYKIQNEVWSKAFLFSASELHIFIYILLFLNLIVEFPILVAVSLAIIIYSLLIASIQTSPETESAKGSVFSVFIMNLVSPGIGTIFIGKVRKGIIQSILFLAVLILTYSISYFDYGAVEEIFSVISPILVFTAGIAWLWSLSSSIKEIISSIKKKEISRYKVFLFFFIPIIILIFLIRSGVIIKKASESSIYFERYDENDGYTYPTPLQYPELAQIRDFIIDSKFPVLHSRFSLLGGFPNGQVRVDLEDINPEYDLIIFSVEYGIRVLDLSGSCSHNEALGMKYNDKVGIVNLGFCDLINSGFDTDNLQRYDFDSGDADLFRGAVRDYIINEVYKFYPSLLYLAAKDKDISEGTLLIISKELPPLNNDSYYGRRDNNYDLTVYENDDLFYDELSPYDIALALLENPKVRNDKEILIQINSIPPLSLKLDPDEYSYDERKRELERINKTYIEVKSSVQDLLNKLK